MQQLIRDLDEEAYSDLHLCLDIKRYTSLNLPFNRSQKSKDVEIIGVEIELINSVLLHIKGL